MLFWTFFIAFLPATLAVKCYICSWSPRDATNTTVMCSDEHFEANIVSMFDCDKGCETYVHIDANGDVVQLRRNCLQPETELTGDCRLEEKKAFTLKRCTCNSHLCNAASSAYMCSGVLLFLILILQFLYHV
ncbi:hypothetical protein X975_16313, partial [Stegodyphus mimosarum]